MRILQLTYDYPPTAFYGMGIHVAGLTRGLRRLGHEVAVATRNNVGLPVDGLDEAGARVIRCEGTWDRDHLQVPSNPGKHFRSIQAQIDLCEQLLDAVLRTLAPMDLIHNHSYATAAVACELSARWQVPLLSTVHVLDASNERMGVSRRPWLGRHVLRGLEGEGLKRSRAIVVPSATIGMWLESEYPICRGRIFVLAHPNEAVVPTKNDYSARCPFTLLYVGRLEAGKGIVRLFEALAMLPKGVFRCVVVGEGRLDRQLKEQAAASGLDVEWLGHVSHDVVVALYRESDAFVCPSLVETYGMAAQEALQAGVPVIATDIEVFRERIQDGVNGVLIPRVPRGSELDVDVSALCRALSRLASDEALRRSLGLKAVVQSAKFSSYQEYAADLLGLVAGGQTSSSEAT